MNQREAFMLMQNHDHLINKKVVFKKSTYTVRRFVLEHDRKGNYTPKVVLVPEHTSNGLVKDLAAFVNDNGTATKKRK